MDSIKITQNGKILAEHSVDSPLSRYGLPVWTILEPEPSPGAALWIKGAAKQWIVIIGVRDGWLVVKQQDGLLCGIIWSDGTYYANLIVNVDGRPVRGLVDVEGLHVGGTIALGGLGSILPIDKNIPVDAPDTGEPVEVMPVDGSRFELEMNRAKSMLLCGTGNADYWQGYQRGLRRAYHGERFGTAAEHALWCEALHSDDPQRAARGRGYRHALRGVYDPFLCRLTW